MYYLLAAAATFNLTCAGTVETTTILGTRTGPYSYTYRIDLDAQKWCNGDCEEINPIYSVQPDAIMLENVNTASPTEEERVVDIIDRKTGEHSLWSINKNLSNPRYTILMKHKGTCEKSAFTGFPNVKTKF